jgi:hypothetical protein
MPIRVLSRLATTGIYLLHGIPRDLQRTARLRAASEGTTLRGALLQALREYAAGTWTPNLVASRQIAPPEPTPTWSRLTGGPDGPTTDAR